VWIGQPSLERPAGYKRKAHERANPFCGERGISRREFNARYTRTDIKAVREAATKTCAFSPKRSVWPSEDTREVVPSEVPGESGLAASDNGPDLPESADGVELDFEAEAKSENLQYLDEWGRPRLSQEDREQQEDGFVDGPTARRVTKDLRRDEELQRLLRPENAAERAEIEAVLGVPLSEYLKQPFAMRSSQSPERQRGKRQSRKQESRRRRGCL